MPGVIQDNVSTSWPTERNNRRLAGLRSSLKRQRNLLARAGKNRSKRLKLNDGINAVLEKLANELVKAGDYSEGYDLFFWLPDDGVYEKSKYRGMAECLLRLNRFEDAASLTENAIQSYPDDIDLRLTRLNALHILGEYENCLNAAKDALPFFPDEAVFAYFIAQSLESLEQWDDAEGRYRILLDENPDDAVVREGLARCLIGKDQPTKAVPLLRRAIATSPEYSGCYYELVNVFTALDQFDKALRVARKAFKLFSVTDGLAYGYLGMSLANNDMEKDALVILKDGLIIYPDEDMILEVLEDIEN